MGQIKILHEEDEVTVEHRTVQDLFIQWNGIKEPDWGKMIAIGMKYIVENWNFEDRLVIHKNEMANNYMVSCQDWVGRASRME